MIGNYHARCGVGEKPEVVIPEAYLSLLGVGMGMMAGVGGTVGGMVGGVMRDTLGSINDNKADNSTNGQSVDEFKARLEKLKMMKEMDLLTDEEFAAAKAKLMSELMS